MLGENIKQLRKQKGFTQEELAIRLNVVRQTVSKWEKNLSVPDAEMLVRLAEQLEVPVTELLGAETAAEPERNEIAEQLSRINEQLAVRNRRSKRIWVAAAVVFAVLAALAVGTVVLTLLGAASMDHTMTVSVSLSDGEPLFSEKEIEDAMDVVTAYFKKNFKGCELTRLSYDEDYTRAQEGGWKKQYDADDAIVLLSDFTTDQRGGDGSLAPDSTYRDWQWVLTRTDRGGWVLRTWGYG